MTKILTFLCVVHLYQDFRGLTGDQDLVAAAPVTGHVNQNSYLFCTAAALRTVLR